VDTSKIQPGDLLEVRMKAGERRSDGRWCVLAADRGWLSSVSPEDILSHTPAPRPLSVGDRVRSRGFGNHVAARGTIRHIIGDRAWVAWDAGGDSVRRLSELVPSDA
jgi:hypothetical protein